MLSNLDALDWHLTKQELEILNEVSLWPQKESKKSTFYIQ
jgi:hypothetical protein